MSESQFSKSFFPQSLYRKPIDESQKNYENINKIDLTLPNLGDLKPELKKKLSAHINSHIQTTIDAIYPKFTKKEIFINKILTETSLDKKETGQDNPTLSQVWNKIEKPVLNRIKTYLIEHYSNEILISFHPKLVYIVQQYTRYLPKHVSAIEKDDLLSVAQIELLETIKAWVPLKSKNIWSLAYSRINGAMKDYIRYITKSDPNRLFEWISDAAVLYTHFNQEINPSKKIETGIELNTAMECLNEREKKIMFLYVKEDLTFANISEKLKISESQVSRIYKKIVEKLKNKLKD